MRIRFVLAASAAALTAACTSTTGGTGFTPVGASVSPSAPAPSISAPATVSAPATRATSTAPVTTPPTSTAPPPTQRIVVRPVDRNGHPAPGYTVQTVNVSVSCPDPSPVAVDPDIRMCFPTAAYAVACWRSADPGWVLCLPDPLLHMLNRLPLSGSFAPVAAPRAPSPLRIVLPDELSCVIRDGGAWERLPGRPQWFGTYGCSMRQTVYGPGNTDGIDRTHPLWTVHVVPDSALGINGSGRPIDVRPVLIGYFVGTAT